MKVCRRETFNAAHRLHNPEWSAEENQRIFGLCNNPNYHGHNYVLEVWLEGQVDPATGSIADLKWLSELIRHEIVDPFDHRNLNLDCPEFIALNPTVENIAYVIWHKLHPHISTNLKLEVRLWETDRNSVWYDGQ